MKRGGDEEASSLSRARAYRGDPRPSPNNPEPAAAAPLGLCGRERRSRWIHELRARRRLPFSRGPLLGLFCGPRGHRLRLRLHLVPACGPGLMRSRRASSLDLSGLQRDRGERRGGRPILYGLRAVPAGGEGQLLGQLRRGPEGSVRRAAGARLRRGEKRRQGRSGCLEIIV